MKKGLLFTLLFISTLLLTACSKNPFNALPGTELVQSDILAYDYYNGRNTEEIFEYTFSQEYYYFIGLTDNDYHFTSINNYQDISNDFITFLEYYDEYIVYDKFINDTFDDSLRLSLGATDGDFNLTDVSIDNNVYDVDAFISIDGGLRIIFSYTEFYHDGELIIIPFYLSIIAYDIHEAYLKEYLPANNDYTPEKAILTKYVTHLIPLPPKIGMWPSTFDEKDDDLLDLGHYMRIVKDTGDSTPHTEEVCTSEVTENCFEAEFSVLTGFIYVYTINDIVTFYEANYGGRYDDGNFIFFVGGETYKISLAESSLEIDYADRAGETIDVITFEITKYND